MKGFNSMNCPYCNSTHIHSRGYRKGVKKYSCCDCKKCFSETTQKNLEERSKYPRCPYCGGTVYKKDVDHRNGRNVQYYKCKVCGKHISESALDKPKIKDTKVVHCIRCNSTNLWKRGLTADKRQRYECKDCGRTFNENPAYRWTSEKDKNFIKMFRGHLRAPVADVVKEVGCCSRTVRNIVHKYVEDAANGASIIVPNIYRPDVNNELKIGMQFTNNEKLYIYENYIKTGVPYSQITEEFHCSESTIKSIKRMFNKKGKESAV